MAETKSEIVCPRCGHTHISVLQESPVPGVWTLYQCDTCLYSWRSSEPERRSSREHYPERFRMNEEQMTHSAPIPEVPPLKKD